MSAIWSDHFHHTYLNDWLFRRKRYNIDKRQKLLQI